MKTIIQMLRAASKEPNGSTTKAEIDIEHVPVELDPLRNTELETELETVQIKLDQTGNEAKNEEAETKVVNDVPLNEDIWYYMFTQNFLEFKDGLALRATNKSMKGMIDSFPVNYTIENEGEKIFGTATMGEIAWGLHRQKLLNAIEAISITENQIEIDMAEEDEKAFDLARCCARNCGCLGCASGAIGSCFVPTPWPNSMFATGLFSVSMTTAAMLGFGAVGVGIAMVLKFTLFNSNDKNKIISEKTQLLAEKTQLLAEETEHPEIKREFPRGLAMQRS